MHEIAELADECTVFRNGRNVATYKAGTKTDAEVVELMIGREYSHVFPPKPMPMPSDKPPVLEARNLSWTDRLKDISLSVRAGEVVGLGGLDGQGQRDLLLALFGVLRGVTGEILIDGKPVSVSSPRAAKSAQDRHGAHPRGPQDRRADAADVGARQSLLRRARRPLALRHHRPRGGGEGDRRDDPAARDPHRRHGHPGRRRFPAATSRRW